jgi:O-antigen ligase
MATVAAPTAETSLLRYSRWGLYATAAGLPLYVVRWHYGPLPTTLLETLIIVTVALYVIARWRDGMRRPLSTPYDIPILLLLLAGAISILVAKDHRGALGLYRAYFIEPVAVFYVALDLLKQANRRLQLVLAFALGSSAFAVLNLAAFGQALAAHHVNVGSAPTALYSDANPVAMYLEPPIALAAGLIFFGQTSRLKVIGVVWLALVGSAFLVMFSKGGYLAITALVLVAILTAPRWRLPLLGALVAAAAVATQIPLVMQRLGTIPPSLNGREAIFGATVDMIRAHPLFGLGIGGFTYQFRGVTPEIYPHNVCLTFWVETGLLGVLAFAVIFFWLEWTGWLAWPTAEPSHRALLWGTLGGLVLWFMHGLVDSPYWKNDMSVEFWLIAALLVIAVRGVRASESAGY